MAYLVLLAQAIQPQKAMRICMIEAANEAIDLETSEGLENAE
jgi:hypothetical protein